MRKSINFYIVGFTGPIGSGCTTLAKNIEKFTPSLWLQKRKKELEIELRNTSIQMNGEAKITELEAMNKVLERYLEERVYIREVLKFEDPKFKYISISTMIVKYVLECINTEDYINWKKDNGKVAEKIEECYENWKVVLEIYNGCKDFKVLDNKQLQDIDSMFMALDELKLELKDADYKVDDKDDCVSYLQYFGDNIRKSGTAFSSKLDMEKVKDNVETIPREVNRYIKFSRNRSENRSNFFLVDSFKNPYDVSYFRDRYAHFYLISLYADKKVRFNRIKNLYHNIEEEKVANEFEDIDKHDNGSNNLPCEIYLQNVARCCYLSDIAINNNINSQELNKEMVYRVIRYLALIISPGCTVPTKEELYMNLAYSLSLKSTCISRKVGAVITDINGSVLGMGWNDVANSQIGCGIRMNKDLRNTSLYAVEIFKELGIEEYLSEDEEEAFCFKDILSRKKIVEKIKGTDICEKCEDELEHRFNIKRLEYCRSLHAEENALLQIAARGGNGVRNGTIYTTTFPCELCAKKIYQSGIKKIVFTEPYPKSISENVFLKDGINKIEIEQFEGVKSNSYYKLFKQDIDKKERQELEKVYNGLM